jgi:GH18 family chitinase
MKKDFANKHSLGGTMVWALDLDDSSTSKSLISTQLQQLRDIGDDVDSNLGFAKKKLATMQKANNIALATFWTDCQAAPQCPDGFC